MTINSTNLPQLKAMLLQSAASAPRRRPAARSLEELYKLPPVGLVTPEEAAHVIQLTESALAVRRSNGKWPPYLKFGRLVRYKIGDLITAPNEAVQT
jgi:hypothetical protein